MVDHCSVTAWLYKKNKPNWAVAGAVTHNCVQNAWRIVSSQCIKYKLYHYNIMPSKGSEHPSTVLPNQLFHLRKNDTKWCQHVMECKKHGMEKCKASMTSTFTCWNLGSMDWCKGKLRGKPDISWKKIIVSCRFLSNQSIDWRMN